MGLTKMPNRKSGASKADEKGPAAKKSKKGQVPEEQALSFSVLLPVLEWEAPKAQGSKNKGPMRVCSLCNRASKDVPHKFACLDKGDPDADKPVEELWGCKQCVEWCASNLGMMTARELEEDKVASADKGKDMEKHFRLLGTDDEPEVACNLDASSTFSVQQEDEVGYYIEEQYGLYSWAEYTAIAKKTPTLNHAREIVRNRMGKEEKLYALPHRELQKPILHVFSKVSVRSKKLKTKVPKIRIAFPRHQKLAVQKVGKDILNSAGVGSLSLRQFSREDLFQKSGGLAFPSSTVSTPRASEESNAVYNFYIFRQKTCTPGRFSYLDISRQSEISSYDCPRPSKHMISCLCGVWRGLALRLA